MPKFSPIVLWGGFFFVLFAILYISRDAKPETFTKASKTPARHRLEGAVVHSEKIDTHKVPKTKNLQLPTNPRRFPVLAKALRPAQVAPCAYLCEENGDCASPAFYECLQHDTQRFGAIGRQRNAFIPGNRQVAYNLFSAKSF